MTERDQAITALNSEYARNLGNLDEEIARLRAGLSHAESLAFSRMHELDRIRRFWLWRGYEALLRLRSGAS